MLCSLWSLLLLPPPRSAIRHHHHHHLTTTLNSIRPQKNNHRHTHITTNVCHLCRPFHTYYLLRIQITFQKLAYFHHPRVGLGSYMAFFSPPLYRIIEMYWSDKSTPHKSVLQRTNTKHKMPFKLKLKKSRQYNVTSKSLFVISVHHLLGKFSRSTAAASVSLSLYTLCKYATRIWHNKSYHNYFNIFFFLLHLTPPTIAHTRTKTLVT